MLLENHNKKTTHYHLFKKLNADLKSKWNSYSCFVEYHKEFHVNVFTLFHRTKYLEERKEQFHATIVDSELKLKDNITRNRKHKFISNLDNFKISWDEGQYSSP